ncbi:MAG: DUF3373 family protein [Desulfurivibrionaceae bacterium]|nr:DUF3373 family protein [Desulfurivibrionaceae bacterium]
MKKVLLTAGALMLWTGTVCAADMVRIPADDYRAIIKSLEVLQQRVVELESKTETAPPAPMAGADGERLDLMADDINNIYDTLDQVETKTLKDRINMGAEYRLRYDSYSYEDLRVTDYANPQEDPVVHSKFNDDGNFTNRFRINMDANISRSLKFHARLAAYHAWGDHDQHQLTSFYNDSNAAHALGDNGLKVDRFYIDWIPEGFPIPLALTVGRHPSSEGPPVEFKENRTRQATYPSLIFDGEADGIVATVGLQRYIGLKDAGLRLAYGKVYRSDMNTTDFGWLDNEDTEDSDIFAAFLEGQIPMISNSLMVFSYAHVWDMPASLEDGTDMDGLVLGDFDLYGAHFQVADLANSGLDLYVSGSINETDPNDDPLNVAYGMGLLTDGDDESHTGWGLVAGARYTLPINALNNPKLGFEYNHGSKYHFTMTMGTNELYNKFAVRGDAYELYYIQPMNRYLFFRAGITHVEYDYTGSGQPAGDPESLDREGLDTTMDNAYLLMDVRF